MNDKIHYTLTFSGYLRN